MRALGVWQVANCIYYRGLGRCYIRGVCTLHGGVHGERQSFFLDEGGSWEDFRKEVTWELSWG